MFQDPQNPKNWFKNKLFFSSTMKNWGLELSNFFDVPKKKIEKKCMFKICFRTHRIQKKLFKNKLYFFRALWLEQRWGNFGRDVEKNY